MKVWAVLTLIVLDGAAVIATYSRFPTTLLYNVRHSDTVKAGFGRELVTLNFPVALVGIALNGLAWPRLHGWLRGLGVVAIALCATIPLVVDQSDLDTKPLNAVPALGLALAIGNLVNDDWLEQVVKRGWTNHEVPSLILPAANWGWPVVLAGAFVVWRLWFRQPSRTTPEEASPAISPSA